MAHAACKNWGGLMAARFFLGVGGTSPHLDLSSNTNVSPEASIAPGFALITGMFYTREEQPARQAAWFIGNSIAVLLGVSINGPRRKITESANKYVYRD
jgi:MFS family permease